MTGILAGLIGSFKKAFGWTIGSVTSSIYSAAVYAPLSAGSYFIFYLGASGYRYSSNGTSWTNGTLSATSGVQGAATNGSQIVVGRGSSATGAYTTDGSTWSATGSYGGASANTALMYFDGTRYLVSSATSNNLSYSTPANIASTWSTATFSASGLRALAIGYDGISRHIVSFDGLSNGSRTTTAFPSTWSTITLPNSGWWISPVYGNSIWVILRAGSSNYATSTNGTTWTSRTLPSNFTDATTDLYGKMLFNNGYFYYYYVNNLYKSSDGINWTTEATVTGGNLDNLNGWAVGNNIFVGVGYNSTSTGSADYLLGT